MNKEVSSNPVRVWLGFAPIVIAGALAAIYALGAIAVYGQFSRAGLNASQTMPLVPLEQILGRGIGSVVSDFSRAWFNLALGAITVSVYWSERDKHVVRRPEDWSRWIWLFPAFLVATAIFRSWGVAVVVGVGTGVMFAVWSVAGYREVGGWKGLAVIACGSLISILPMTIAASLIEPPPLPRTELTQTDGVVLQGGLVASGDMWYLADEDNNVKGIPASEIEGSVIDYQDRKETAGLWDLVF